MQESLERRCMKSRTGVATHPFVSNSTDCKVEVQSELFLYFKKKLASYNFMPPDGVIWLVSVQCMPPLCQAALHNF